MCSLGKTSPLATEMIEVARFLAQSPYHCHHNAQLLSPHLEWWCSRCSPFWLTLAWGVVCIHMTLPRPSSLYQVSPDSPW